MTNHAALARPLASITTATVDVQVLRIGAKQMTLAVFRQLEQDDNITGPIWGRVNYCHKDFSKDYKPLCGGKPNNRHCHVVWQRGGELRHGIVALAPLRIGEHVAWADELWRELTRKVWIDDDDERRAFGQQLRQWLTSASDEMLGELTDARNEWSQYSFRSAEIATFLNTLLDRPTSGWTREREFDRDQPILALPQLFIAV